MGKNQHYVPQFYLRNFALEPERKCVRIFLIKNCKSLIGGIKDQASRDFFYGHENDVEDALSQIEGEMAVGVQHVICGDDVPDTGIIEFLIILAHIRTEKAAEIGNVMVEKTLNDLANSLMPDNIRELTGGAKVNILCPGFVAMWGLQGYVSAIQDLSFCIIENITSQEFVTSDNPSILYNSFLESKKYPKPSRGAALFGAFFFLPLSPRFGVMLYDSLAYEIDLKFRNGAYVISNRGDVDRINCLQIVFCKNSIYFKSEFMARHIGLYLRKHVEHRSMHKSEISVYRELSREGDGSRYLIRDDDLIDNYDGCSKMYNLRINNVYAGISIRFLKIRDEMHKMQLHDPPIRPHQLALYKERLRQRSTTDENNTG